jgi:hypothetical protein
MGDNLIMNPSEPSTDVLQPVDEASLVHSAGPQALPDLNGHYDPDPENFTDDALERRVATLPDDEQAAAEHLLIDRPASRKLPINRCIGKVNGTNRRCRAPAKQGAAFCFMHGGGRAQVVARIEKDADAALHDLAHKAVVVLDDAMGAEVWVLDKGELRSLGPDHRIRTKAADSVLDRSGHGKESTVDVQASVRLAALIGELDAPKLDDQPFDQKEG